MSNVIYNNFTAGLVSPKLAGNYSSGVYHNGCSVLENFKVMLQGGITRRPPVEHIATTTAKRLIPFIIDVDESYMVELYVGYFKMWRMGVGGWEVGYYGTTPFTSDDDFDEIQFAQNYDTLFLAHPDHIPQKLTFNGTSYVMSNLNITHKMQNYEDESGAVLTYDPMGDHAGAGLFAGPHDHPKCVSYLNNRLWFASSDNHPYRYWASCPFEPEDFSFYQMVKVTDDVLSAEAIIDAVTSGEEDVAVETRFSYKHYVTDDCAIREDASSNDAIRWISAKGNIMLGTASGEYIISGNVTGTNTAISDLSSYGSAKGVQAVQANNEVIFVQSGGKRVRSLLYGSEGLACNDLTYQCDLMIPEHGGVVRMAWQRVPEPTLYVVLKDGTLGVLSYDRSYGLCGWAHWTYSNADGSQADVKDVCVSDTPDGQDVFLLMKRGDEMSIERVSEIDFMEWEDVSYKDLGTISYVSEMVTNPYEYTSSSYGSSLGKMKRFKSITCRLYGSKAFIAGYGDKYMQRYEGSVGLGDRDILLQGGYSDFVKMKIGSVGDGALTLLAFALDMEAER